LLQYEKKIGKELYQSINGASQINVIIHSCTKFQTGGKNFI